MTSLIFKFILILMAGEVLLHFVLFGLSKLIGKINKDKISLTSILKGIIERTFVVISLFFGIAQSLTLLGALKIATRIKDTEDKVSNDFFLMGNLLSVLFGIMYCNVLQGIVS